MCPVPIGLEVLVASLRVCVDKAWRNCVTLFDHICTVTAAIPPVAHMHDSNGPLSGRDRMDRMDGSGVSGCATARACVRTDGLVP